ncbi:hypothetical protein Tco_0019813 [Tanacetum coccineum]
MSPVSGEAPHPGHHRRRRLISATTTTPHHLTSSPSSCHTISTSTPTPPYKGVIVFGTAGPQEVCLREMKATRGCVWFLEKAPKVVRMYGVCREPRSIAALGLWQPPPGVRVRLSNSHDNREMCRVRFCNKRVGWLSATTAMCLGILTSVGMGVRWGFTATGRVGVGLCGWSNNATAGAE